MMPAHRRQAGLPALSQLGYLRGIGGSRQYIGNQSAGLFEGLSGNWAKGKGMKSCQVYLYIWHNGSTIS